MFALSSVSVNGQWNYGAFWEGLLKNSHVVLPVWVIARVHIHNVFFRLQPARIPEITCLLPFSFPPCPIFPPVFNGEAPIEYERRCQFESIEYYHAVCDQVEIDMQTIKECNALRTLKREIPRLRHLLFIIESILLGFRDTSHRLSSGILAETDDGVFSLSNSENSSRTCSRNGDCLTTYFGIDSQKQKEEERRNDDRDFETYSKEILQLKCDSSDDRIEENLAFAELLKKQHMGTNTAFDMLLIDLGIDWSCAEFSHSSTVVNVSNLFNFA